MSVKVIKLSVDNLTNTTEVTVQIYETVNNLSRLKDTYTFELPQRYEFVNEFLLEAVYQKLQDNGVTIYPEE